MKSLIAVLAVAACVSWNTTALAQTAGFDGKTIKIVVPFAAGGAQDVIARLVGNKLSSRIGASVIIENKGGAAGLIGADTVAKADPDGTTLLMATGGAITIAPNRTVKLTYDPRVDFAPVALIADTPMTIAVRNQSPFKSLEDLIREAKARPGGISYASTGSGTVSNLTAELFAQGVGITFLHVPYRGAAPATTDLLSGQIDIMVTSSASIEPLVAGGQARVLASFTPARLPSLAGAPTISEASGLKGLEVPVWVGVLAPAKTPVVVIEKLAVELKAICGEADIVERFAKLGALATCGGPAELGMVLRDDFVRWRDVITKGNIKLE